VDGSTVLTCAQAARRAKGDRRYGDMTQLVRTAMIVAVTLALSVGVATANAGGGNSENAKLCQKGGWMNLQGSDGTQFANQDDCVSFGAHGGTLVAIPSNPPSVSLSFTQTSEFLFCFITVNLSSFTPNTAYSVDLSILDGFFTGSFPVTTDSSGSASVGTVSFAQNGSWASASVGSVSSGNQTIACF
jgi:hypothetical protein